jgi:hypothetical protein
MKSMSLCASTSFVPGRDYTENPEILSVDGYNMGEIFNFGLQEKVSLLRRIPTIDREIRPGYVL